MMLQDSKQAARLMLTSGPRATHYHVHVTRSDPSSHRCQAEITHGIRGATYSMVPYVKRVGSIEATVACTEPSAGNNYAEGLRQLGVTTVLVLRVLPPNCR
jgi:hypothetical protein